MASKKRRTPADDPKLLDEWLKWHRHNTEELGLSKRASYRMIAKQYGCSAWTTPRHYIEPKVRADSLKKRKASRIPYSEDPRMDQRRTHARVYSDIRRHPDIYLAEVYRGRDTPLSLDEITDCLHKLTSIEMRNKTFLNIVRKYEQKHGRQILNEVQKDDSIVYRKL